MDSSVLTEAPKTKPARDPVLREPVAHATGTGVGATIGGVVGGAFAGTFSGPGGTIVGAAIGAVVGGLAGKSIAAAICATAEPTHEQEDLSGQAYLEREWNFEDYGRAYRFGAEAYHRSQGRSFDDAEPELKRDWERVNGHSNLPWEHAKYASRDAWQRGSESLERACLGDSERDGN